MTAGGERNEEQELKKGPATGGSRVFDGHDDWSLEKADCRFNARFQQFWR
jgi:hypothetical protein